MARPPGGPGYGALLASARRLLDAVAAADPPDDVVRDATAKIAAACAALEPHVVDEVSAPAGRRLELPGRGHPGLVPFTSEQMSDHAVAGSVTFTRAHLGGGGAAHGGMIPLLFDDLLGYLATSGGGRSPTRTAYLHVNYRRLTPLDVPLTAAAGIDRVEGRKIFATGELRLGSDVLAEAEGLFIIVRPEHLRGSTLERSQT